MKLFKKQSIRVLFIILLFFSHSSAQNVLKRKNKWAKNKNILIVYLSRTKNTEAIAKMIHNKVGGDLVSLTLKISYPENYAAMVAQVEKENQTNFLPILQTKIDSIEKYDVVFIGFPTWGMRLPPPIKSFLSQYNLIGKSIIPFNTNAGYGLGTTIQTLKSLSPKSIVMKEYSTKGGVERDGILYVMKGNKQIQVASEVNRWLYFLGF